MEVVKICGIFTMSLSQQRSVVARDNTKHHTAAAPVTMHYVLVKVLTALRCFSAKAPTPNLKVGGGGVKDDRATEHIANRFRNTTFRLQKLHTKTYFIILGTSLVPVLIEFSPETHPKKRHELSPLTLQCSKTLK